MSDQSFTDILNAALVAFGVATTQTEIEWKRRYEAIETVRNFLEGLRERRMQIDAAAEIRTTAERVVGKYFEPNAVQLLVDDIAQALEDARMNELGLERPGCGIDCAALDVQHKPDCPRASPGPARIEQPEAALRGLKASIDTRINDLLLCETKPDYDDSITGINYAWDVVRKACDEYIARAALAPEQDK